MENRSWLERNGMTTMWGMVCELEGLGRASVHFVHTALMLEPKGPTQAVTICVVRLLDGGCCTFVGQAVCNPNDQAVVEGLGDRMAFIRAIQQALPDLPQEASHIARKALWEKKLEKLPKSEGRFGEMCRCVVERASHAGGCGC